MLDRCTFESQDVGGYTVDAQEVGEHQSAICNQNSALFSNCGNRTCYLVRCTFESQEVGGYKVATTSIVGITA